jgi:hypothetical protein
MTVVRLDLQRTFLKSRFKEGSQVEDADEDFSTYLSSGHSGWADLLARRLVVVLGEAGSGKTWEFQDQAKRLRHAGNSAFFFPLNKITSSETFRQALGDEVECFLRWRRSSEHAYLFLDAVDESRLAGAGVFERALQVIMSELGAHAARVSILLSSRISDWMLASVRAAVDGSVLSRLTAAAQQRRRVRQSDGNLREEATEPLAVEVFTLAPLAPAQAQRLAAAHGAVPANDFWQCVQEGDYGLMVRHPRDVEWLARRWAHRRELGSYIELMEDSVSQRLKEHNDGYIAAGAVLSQEMLRSGAERLAAASVFCGRPFISLPGEPNSDSDVDPATVLTDWDAQEQRRLLGVSLFDEATYGRVKFQHRSAREYLAAQWVHRLIGQGLPLTDAMTLFGGRPYMEPVLLNATRATLCWLAALNVAIREEVIRTFPEMLMFEGDPTAWTEAEVVDAFQRYIVRLEAGFRPDWWNGLGELRRVARCIPSRILSQLLRSYAKSQLALPKVLAMVHHGRKAECADDVFSIYRNSGPTSRLSLYALHVLPELARPKHRAAIKSDLLRNHIKGNEYVAAAIEAVGFENFKLRELAVLFSRAGEDMDYGGGPMARAITEWSASCSLDGAMLLIGALLKALPATKGRRVLASEVEGTDRWKLHALPVCARRAVNQLDGRGSRAPSLLFEVALYIEQIHNTAHASNEQFAKLRAEIETKPDYRRDLILAISRNGRLDELPGRIFLGSSCQIFLSENDLQFLAESANSAPDAATRLIWFRLAEWLSYRTSPKKQAQLFKQLLSIKGEEKEQRRLYILEQQELARKTVLQQQQWREKDAQRAEKVQGQLKKNRQTLKKCISQLESGQHFGAIQFLVGVAEDRRGRARYTQVNPELVRPDFGRQIAKAFERGLALFWRNHDAPDVLKFENNEVPWVGMLGLASLNHAVASGLEVSSLSHADVTNAIRYCVWELDEPPRWFQTLASSRPDLVVSALRPWALHELGMTEAQGASARVMELVLRSPSESRVPILQLAVDMGMQGRIPRPGICRQVFSAAVESEVLTAEAAGHWTRSVLAKPHGVVSVEEKLAWLNGWFELDLAAAWEWVNSHRTSMRDSRAAVALCVGRSISTRARRQDGSTAAHTPISTLENLYVFLSPYIAMELDATSRRDEHWHPVEQGRNWIPGALAATPGAAAHDALLRLKASAADQHEKHWLQTFVLAHAVTEAQRLVSRVPDDLMNVGSAFCADPRTANDLCHQVMARLVQIRTGIESGPFSDRVLFGPRIPEKHLQLWLAARLHDTPSRRFSPRFAVHREPEVDASKRTDIEVSSRGHKVCIEIKPVDKRRYGAADLRDTLRRQLVKQYLKGGSNSRHGVLVLLWLEDKQWNIPHVARRASFTQLVDHLSDYAHTLCAVHPEIESLLVFGIDCRAGSQIDDSEFGRRA